MSFTPVAVVGRACLLPGASSPGQLWDAVVRGEDLLSTPEPGRWSAPVADVLDEGAWRPDHVTTARGGYVGADCGATRLDGLAVPEEELAGEDRLVRWVVHTAAQALRDATGEARAAARTGAVFGNLSYPTTSLVRAVKAHAVGAAYGANAVVDLGLDTTSSPAAARFMSARPAAVLARAVGLDAGAFALDAACASSLYALKVACDRLADGTAHVMLAGGVCAADVLLIHQGFAALRALSPTGESRPFHAGADGLVPAEGCAFVALKCLDDAVRDGDTIHGVIRGIGLSNDGRTRGLLVPDTDGQQLAVRRAYATAGVDPATVSFVECHATGTQVGDAVELRTLRSVFGEGSGLAIGSLKSNLGHAITTAGAAGLLKVLEGMRTGVLAPSRHTEAPIDGLVGAGFRLLGESEPWDVPGPLRAGVSAFGFGGNNAHVVVERYEPSATAVAIPVGVPAPCAAEVAIIGIGVRAGDLADRAAFVDALTGVLLAQPAAIEAVELPREGLHATPKDLGAALGQHTALLAAALEAVQDAGTLPVERTSVLVGMEADPDAARYAIRWDLPSWARAWGQDKDWLAAARDLAAPALDSAGTLGAMPNLPANRINRQFGFRGPSHTVSAGGASGLVAADLAAGALRRGEIDAAVVAAVDLSVHPVHAAAARDAGIPGAPGDAAVALVLKRLADAEADGDRVYAVLDGPAVAGAGGPAAPAGADLLGDALAGILGDRFGTPYAAAGALRLAAGALCLHHRARPDGRPWIAPGLRRAATVDDDPAAAAVPADTVRALGLTEHRVSPRRPDRPGPCLHVYAGADRTEVLKRLATGRAGGTGPARAVLVAADEDELVERRSRAERWLRDGAPPGRGVHFAEQPIGGELGFVFTPAGAAYQGMGRELLRWFPELADGLAAAAPMLEEVLGWVYGESGLEPTPSDYLWSTSAVSQMHTALTRDILGLRPTALLGSSSGETSTLFAGGVWTDFAAMYEDIEGSGIMDRELGVTFNALRAAWGEDGDWRTFNVLAPVADVRAALDVEPRAHLAIINSPQDCVIGGEPAAVLRVVATLGAERAVELGYKLVCHVPEVEVVADLWREIHTRHVTPQPGLRFYANAHNAAYEPTSDAVAAALVGQAVATIDFPATIEAAYADGVRVFVEHGPHNASARWISETLGDRPHVAVALDRRGGGIEATVDAVAALVAAGLNVDLDALHERMTPLRASAAAGPALRLAARAPAPALPPVEPSVDRSPAAVGAVSFPPSAAPTVPMTPSARALSMPLAPPLAPVLGAAAPRPVGGAPADAPPAPAAPAPPPPAPATVLAVAEPALTPTDDAGFAAHSAAHLSVIEMLAGLHERYLDAAAGGVPTVVDAGAAAVAPQAAPTPAAVAPAPATVPSPTPAPPTADGVVFDRAALQIHASGRISEIFGPAFAAQDDRPRQCRMPEPPLLLADRVTKLDAVPASMGLGTIVTETDVREDSWYLHDGVMPAGIMIESGQADLMLISYLGMDLQLNEDRVYRLLGCTLTYGAPLPRAGETLRYEISVDGHAQHDDIRLFFFHYDCTADGQPRLAVRNGQAGFFTDQELAETAGETWSASDVEPDPGAVVDAPVATSDATAFTQDQLQAFADGDLHACFGPNFALGQTHTHSPRIQGAERLFLDEVTVLDPAGGPWGRGYLRAETALKGDEWFFDGHFKNDPCMPGNFMFEATVQAMSIYLAGTGHTLRRDGWRFEPVQGEPFDLRCRGQVTPRTRSLVVEVFVEELAAGPVPTLRADVLVTADGVKAFHGRRIGLQLVPGWPLESRAELRAPEDTHTDIATADGMRFGYPALLAAAWGQPSQAFGHQYARFDGVRRVARLPGPPYHFMSRVTRIDGDLGGFRAGSEIELAYDIPPDAWYFAENAAGTMPFAVLLEAALQPCGWLACYVGSPLQGDDDLAFRNLDGTGTVLAEISPGAGTLKTVTRLTSLAQSAGMIITGFDVRCTIDDVPVYDLKTVFGFFPPAALAAQLGLPTSDEHREVHDRPSDFLADLTSSASGCDGPRLAGPMLRMLDRVTGFWPTAGDAGLGVARGEKDVDPAEWFFKAHFFQDPVQPGSLGIEALIQLLQWYMLETGLTDGTVRFEAIEVGRPMTWKYRGQVVPVDRTITSTIEVTAAGVDERGAYAVCQGSLWRDGMRIYDVQDLAMRAVRG